MLFVHFTPKANLKRIKRTGLRPGKRITYGQGGLPVRSVYLRPLLHNDKTVVNGWNDPEWWRPGTAKHDHAMAKIVVRLPDDAIIYHNDKPMTVADYGRLLARKHRERIAEACRESSPSGWYDYWLFSCVADQVQYCGSIPPESIVAIYDRSNTGERTRAYRRQRVKRRIGETE